jgi:hypothetical protein
MKSLDNTSHMPRFDFVFSYWIFIWYLLYEYKIISYNPKIDLYLALCHNLVTLCLMIYFKNSLIYILIFVLVQMCIKVYPIWTLHNTYTTNRDWIAMIGLFAVYNLWLAVNNENIIHLHEKAYDALTHNKINTPIIYLIDKYIYPIHSIK